jgi:hypothetical protein
VSETVELVRKLVSVDEVRISEHGYDELSKDGILVVDVLDGLAEAIVVEDYPTAGRGPSVLLLQMDGEGRPIHVVWGVPSGLRTPAVLVTAYRPDPTRWSADFRRRMP